MGIATSFEPEKLIVAMLYTETTMASELQQRLISIFGEMDLLAQPYDFSEISPYYNEEMQGRPKRLLMSFTQCIDPARLAEIKRMTNAIEAEYAVDGNRRINLDPGCIGCGRLTLATTKNAGHRIPLQDGIYAELTLFYARGGWHPFPWTYMDFKTTQVHDFLTQARKIYMRQRKAYLSNR